MPTSHVIGKDLEDQVKSFLRALGILYEKHKQFSTWPGSKIEPDFWVPSSETRPAVIIECKNFGVEAQSVASSRKRKAEESLYLPIQTRRYCDATAGSKTLLITSKEPFLSEQISLLTAELGPNFKILSITETDQLRKELISS
jgi:hypothetical protein